MKTKFTILALALGLVLGMGFGLNAHAQTATSTVGYPTTGAGGEAPLNIALLVGSVALVIGGASYLNRARSAS